VIAPTDHLYPQTDWRRDRLSYSYLGAGVLKNSSLLDVELEVGDIVARPPTY
jgi:hypothetical protein